jgi:hypothetical protein
MINKYINIFIIFGIIFYSCNKKENIVEPPKEEPTTHEFEWKIDTIRNSIFSTVKDVWGTSPNSVYAVGFIQYISNDEDNTPFMHFDGEKWKGIKVQVSGYLIGIYGFSDIDIWMVGDYMNGYSDNALILNFTGIGFRRWEMTQYPTLLKVWGTSSKDVIAVGLDGIILHYDGDKWEKQESGTNLPIRDVWGFAPNDVYALGSDYDKLNYKLLHYDGKTWKGVNIGNYPNRENLMSIWGNNNKDIWAIGDYFYHYNDSGWIEKKVIKHPALPFKVRGSNWNNIFCVGAYGLVMHYNGIEWKEYSELINYTNDIKSFYSVWTFKDNVIMGGYLHVDDVQGIPVTAACIMRGKRK